MPKSRYLSGELFDLTVPSINNEFGWHKIWYSLQYGISFPLEKMIHELEMIMTNTADDKSAKRKARLDFLRIFQGIDIFENYFQKFCNYINGGDGTCQYDTTIILAVSGGNIITCFAQAIVNIYENYVKLGGNYGGLITFNKICAGDADYINYIASAVSELDQDDWDSIVEISKKPYSDFDYNLLPNLFPKHRVNLCRGQSRKLSDITSIGSYYEDNRLDNIQTAAEDSKDPAGFLLFRIKSIMLAQERGVAPLPPGSRSACWNYLNAEEYQSLFPQGVQENMKEKVEDQDDIDGKKQDCLDYINFLLNKKRTIQQETRYNIDNIVSLFVDGKIHDTVDVNGVPVAVHNPAYSIQAGGTSLNAIVEYLHATCYHLNIFIGNWLTNTIQYDNLGRNHTDLNTDYVIRLFSSLDTLLNGIDGDPVLSRLCTSLMNYFLNDPRLHTETILDNRLNLCEHHYGGNCEPLPASKITLIPNKASIMDPLRVVYGKIQDQLYSNLGIPDGVHITINAIETDNDDNGSLTIENIEEAEAVAPELEIIPAADSEKLAEELEEGLRAWYFAENLNDSSDEDEEEADDDEPEIPGRSFGAAMGRPAEEDEEDEEDEYGSDDFDPEKARPSCRYGAECYNHSDHHRGEYAHPGDPDYEEYGGIRVIKQTRKKRKTRGKKTHGNKTRGKKPHGKKTRGKKPHGKKTRGNKTRGNKTRGKKNPKSKKRT